MKTSFFIYVALICSALPLVGQEWIGQNAPNENGYSSVNMVDTNEIYVSTGPRIYKSIDKANSWEEVYEGENQSGQIYTTFMSETGRLYSARDMANTDWCRLFYSDNHGDTWTELPVPFVNEPICIYFLNDDIGFIGGNQRIVRTADGGASWKTVTSDVYSAFRDIHFFNDNEGIACGGATVKKVLKKTYDGGLTWESVSAPGLSHRAMQFVNEQVGYMASINRVSKTMDGGETWTSLEVPDAFDYRRIHFVTPEVGYLFTFDYLESTGGWNYGSLIYKSIDGGASWTEVFADQNQVYAITDIDFVGNYGIMVGDVNGIYATELDLQPTSVQSHPMEKIVIYPVPTRDVLRLDVESVSQVWIYDNHGKELLNIKTGDQEIDVAELPAGIYTIRISAAQLTHSQQFIKL